MCKYFGVFPNEHINIWNADILKESSNQNDLYEKLKGHPYDKQVHCLIKKIVIILLSISISDLINLWLSSLSCFDCCQDFDNDDNNYQQTNKKPTKNLDHAINDRWQRSTQPEWEISE